MIPAAAHSELAFIYRNAAEMERKFVVSRR
jgi:hypothetical protein